MFDDDARPKNAGYSVPRALDALSVPELRDYVALLKEEIARAEADIAKKEKHKSAADALFGGG